ncbi:MULTISPECIES: peptide deformylase [unclassified Sinorhizobium]|uniref:peptide deformylase n=1 Tax=unclassified Sinorhizobium TaxID=2613772 RepID=UPI0035235C01
MPDAPILPIDDPLLCRPSLPVDVVNEAVKRLAEEMFAIMDREQGAGLAAVQIGKPLRLVVIDTLDSHKQRHRLAMINAEIISVSEDLVIGEEGCLSMPGYGIPVPRYREVNISYRDLDGRDHHLHATGPLAVCVQHEVDHTNGVLFFDRVSRLRRQRAKDYFRKVRRHHEVQLS